MDKKDRLAQPEQEIESDQDYVEDDGCPTEKAVLQRFWREHQMQEPVATLFGSLPVYDVSPKRRKPPTQDLSAPLTVNGVSMYPQREWQTLTDEEMFSLWVRCPAETEDRFAFARAIEAKLKAKNG